MKYLIQYFYKTKHKEERKQYKNIDEACVKEDKIMKDKKELKGILIESKRTWRILFNNMNLEG